MIAYQLPAYVIVMVILTFTMSFYNLKYNKNIIYLILFLIISGLEGFSLGLMHLDEKLSWYPILFYNFTAIHYLKAPFFYLFVRGVVYNEFTFKKSDVLHLIPFALKLISTVPYYFTSWEYKSEMAFAVIDSFDNFISLDLKCFYPHRWDFALKNLQMLSYVFYSIYFFIHFKNNYLQKENKAVIKLQKWLYILSAIIILSTVVGILHGILYQKLSIDAVAQNPLIHTTFYLSIVLFLTIPVLFFFFPTILYGITFKEILTELKKPNFEKEKENNKTNLQTEVAKEEIQQSNLEYKLLSEQILELIKSKKLFLNPKFQISNLAMELEKPVHQVQFCISNYLNVSFSDLKNKFRINYALELLKDNKNYTLDYIARDVGFASVPNFYKNFKRFTDMTPSEWLKKNKENNN